MSNQDEILETSVLTVKDGKDANQQKFGNIGQLLSAAQTISKMKSNIASSRENNGQTTMEFKNITESYLIEQIILMTEMCYQLREYQKKIEQFDLSSQTKQKDQQMEERDQSVKDIFRKMSEDGIMEYLLNGNYENEILQDILDICLVVFNEFMQTDQYSYQESPLNSLFYFLSQLTLLPECQYLLLNSKSFYELSSRFSKKSIKECTFWQRELSFLKIISNIISYQEIIDFTSIQFLQYAEIIIQFYDYIRKDHSKEIQNKKNTKRKDQEKTPPFCFEEGREQVLSHLALLPAYLVEFSALQKYQLTLNFDGLSKEKKPSFSHQESLYRQYTKLAILCRMCFDSIEKNEISKHLGEIVQKISDMVMTASPIIKRMVLAFYKYYVKTNDLRCWFKFSSPHLAIDATNTIQSAVIIGNPHYFGDEIGLYQNWGAFFDEGDMIYLKDHLKLDYSSQIRSYSISLWFIYPFRTLKEYLNPDEKTFIDIVAQSQTPINRQQRKPTKPFRTFIQCESGNGCILGIQNEQKLVFFDDEFRMHSFEMISKNEGWNNVILSVDNITQNVKIYLNSKEIANKFNVTISRNIAFVGNSFTKIEPCGTLCDLRFFESIIPDELKEKIVHYNRIQNMPDFLYYDLEQFNVCQTIDQILEKGKKEEKIIIDCIKCMIALSTNQYTKGKLIASGLFNKVVQLTFHKNFEIRILSQKSLLYFY